MSGGDGWRQGGGSDQGISLFTSLHVCEWVCRVQEYSSAAARVMSDSQAPQRLEIAVGECARRQCCRTREAGRVQSGRRDRRAVREEYYVRRCRGCLTCTCACTCCTCCVCSTSRPQAGGVGQCAWSVNICEKGKIVVLGAQRWVHTYMTDCHICVQSD